MCTYPSSSFGGEVVAPEFIRQHPRTWRSNFDLDGIHERNSKPNRRPELLACAKQLRAQYERVGVIGYCFGGWSSFFLGSKTNNPSPAKCLVDCISAAHPTWLTKEEMDEVAVPVQILAPEHDPAFNPELKEYANRTIPTKGVPYDYQFFPGVEHAFTTRGNPEDTKELRAMVRGKNAQVNWMKEWLHGDKMF